MAQSRLSQYMRVSPSYASSAATPPRCAACVTLAAMAMPTVPLSR